MTAHERRRAGMTLVETIVAMAIVGALVAILVPAVSAARGGGRAVQCRANLRQMAIAAAQYAAIWDRHPVALRYESVDGAARRVAWDWVTTFAGGELVGPGPLWSFTDDPGRVMQCPDYFGDANFAGDPHTGYNYNTSYVGGEATHVEMGWEVVRTGVPPAACRRTARCAMFGCGGWSGGANKFMRAPLNPENGPLPVTYAGGQAFRHAGGATHVARIDCHVDASFVPQPGALATEALLEGILDHPRNGFLSEDDSAYDPQ